jgi:DNA polymerase I
MNFPIQGNGAEVLRLACIYCTQAGVKLCATLHDAILIEYPLERADEMIGKAQECMERGSEEVLDGFRVRTDVKRIDYPERYRDKRGEETWEAIWKVLDELDHGVAA